MFMKVFARDMSIFLSVLVCSSRLTETLTMQLETFYKLNEIDEIAVRESETWSFYSESLQDSIISLNNFNFLD